MSKETVIVSPHADDELIGCYSILNDVKIKPVIIYTESCDEFRQQEVMKIKEHFSIKAQMFCRSIPTMFLTPDNTFYFPDPSTEIHPAHRMQGMVGEGLARQGLNVIFYSTNMNAPYIREEKNPENKKEMLDLIYTSQSDLWKYDHKYFLFEGFTKWLF